MYANGTKRHIAVDTQRLHHVITVTTADITDRQGALQAFSNHKENLRSITNVLADGGYSGEKFSTEVK